jgi:hypothetical protein
MHQAGLPVTDCEIIRLLRGGRSFFRLRANLSLSLSRRISSYCFLISGSMRSRSNCCSCSFDNAAIDELWMGGTRMMTLQ